ncbi:putative manganese-dependent inorganic pyrophosphatase [Chlamydia abortus]|uniref:CBS domain-containing protein n=1 Tax=Paenibacillus residui TaxID=629724 RepID=A0ABW3D8X9_9BACL|nr:MULTISPECIES: CBS domain-containing protein [Paenibacillaceae]SHE10521.1 putative manganese-dependent inorganic pyrophosphatase [Chlamydia abortus]
MNIAFFLLPKHEVIHLTLHTTLRQTIEKMEYHRYTAVPILKDDGTYVGSVTEGDLLWFFKNNREVNFDNAHRHTLAEVPLKMQNKSVRIDSNMQDLIRLVKVQNFVPVVDDTDKFIGIVRRSDIIEFCSEQIFKEVNSR